MRETTRVEYPFWRIKYGPGVNSHAENHRANGTGIKQEKERKKAEKEVRKVRAQG